MKIILPVGSIIKIDKMTVKLIEELTVRCDPQLTVDIFRNIQNDLNNVLKTEPTKRQNTLAAQMRDFFTNNLEATTEELCQKFPTISKIKLLQCRYSLKTKSGMKIGEQKKIKEKQAKETRKLEMIELKKQGLSFIDIGKKYNVGIDTVIRNVGNVRDTGWIYKKQ